MNINKMRLGLTYIFYENDNINSTAKIQLINFIEQADMHQLKVLCMDGDLISKDKLDENARQIVDDRFDDSIFDKINKAALEGIKEAAGLAAIGAGAIAAGVVGQYALNMRKVKAQCKQYKGDKEKFKKCVAKAKASLIQKKKAGVKEGKNFLVSEASRERIQKKIGKLQGKLKDAMFMASTGCARSSSSESGIMSCSTKYREIGERIKLKIKSLQAKMAQAK